MISLLLLSTIRGSLLLVFAAAVAYACRSKPAALRHIIWTLAIAGQLVLPVLGIVAPQHDVAIRPNGNPVNRAVAALTEILNPSGSNLNGPLSAAANQSAPAALSRGDNLRAAPEVAAPWTREQIFTALWMLGVLLISLRFITGTIMVARETRRASKPVPRNWILLAGRIQEAMNLRRSADLRWGTERAVPFTWGILSPVICLPADTDTWTEDRLRMVLIHELSHIERFDALTETMSQIALIIFWFNPLLWIAVRRMRTEREHACDDRVLLSGVRPSTYTQELVTMMKSIGQDGVAPGFSAMAMARRSQFESRMLAVLNERTARDKLGRRMVATVGITTAAIVMLVASVRPASARVGSPAIADNSSSPAFTWDQSTFDELVADCQLSKPKQRIHYCEVRAVDVATITGAIEFNGGYIDGAIFTSAGEGNTSARALVRAEGSSAAGARALASQVITSVSDGVLRSKGPGGRSNDWWVIYEVTLPRGRTVRARTELGQIALRDFEGRADIAAVNGPLQVIGAAGDIKGRTESGPIFVGLSGSRWTGAGLDLQSQNGPIYLSIPSRYSAHLITGTTNGPLDVSYALTVRHMNSKHIDTTIGDGGPTVRVTTLNGPADIR